MIFPYNDSADLIGGICFKLYDPKSSKMGPQDSQESVPTAYIHLKVRNIDHR